jgi:UDP-N-acetylglucosamine:LPS N-acetylglucosamine transferase
MTAAPKPTALVILSGGGFTFETKCLFRAIGDDFHFVYLATEYGGTPGEPGIPPGPRYQVPQFASVTHRSIRRSALAFIGTFTRTISVLRAERIDLIIAIGCSHAVPMLLAGRLRGCRTVYLESITRADRLSNTGRIVYHLRLATKFLVQWPALQRRYKGSDLGTIL